MLIGTQKKLLKNILLSVLKFVNIKRTTLVLSCLIFLPPTLIACGGEEEYTQVRGVSRRNRKFNNKGSKSKGSKGQGGVEVGVGIKIPVRLKRKALFTAAGWSNTAQIRETVKNARDPFQPDIIELKDQEEIKVDPTSVQRNLVVKVPLLVQQLTFTGSLTGSEVNSAMLEDSAGMGYTVRVGDVIGTTPEFVRVQRITANEIKFEPILGISNDEAVNSPRLIKKLRELDTNQPLARAKGTP
jgi:hypothetical protein